MTGREGSSRICLRVLVVLATLVTASAVRADENRSFEVDLDKARAIWNSGPPLEEVADLFRVKVSMGEHSVMVDTHLFGGPVKVIPYHDSDGVIDAAGKRVERGDQFLSELFPVGSVGIAVRHHRSRYRNVDLGGSGAVLSQELGLRNTHIEVLLGVEREGQPGVITLNSPQTYEHGRFGQADYPLVVFRFRFPDARDDQQVRALEGNLRAWLLAYDALLGFPVRYRGKDPLSAHDPESVREHGVMAVRAIAGDSDAKQWFRDPENLLYCSEYALLSLNSAILLPLNEETFEPLVGSEVWSAFLAEVAKQNRGEESRFTSLNSNELAGLVRFDLPAALDGDDYWSRVKRQGAEGLPIEPMTLVDLFERSIRILAPAGRKEGLPDEARVEFLERVRPIVYGLLQLPAEGTAREDFERLYDSIEQVQREGALLPYDEFRAHLDPLLEQARQFLCEVQGPDDCKFAPPAIYPWLAQGEWSSDRVKLEYLGHGFHVSLVKTDPADWGH